MRFSAGMVCKPLVEAIMVAISHLIFPPGVLPGVLLVLPLASSSALAQAPAVPAVALPAAFRNAPAGAIHGSTRDTALGEAELARLIALTQTHSPVRAQALARISAARRSFTLIGNDIEQRLLQAELARVDHQLAEEIAHAWFDSRAATTRLAIADVLDALATQGLQLVNQRLAAGVATQAELERMHEAAIKARTLRARAAQERGAAAARIAALTGEQAAHIAPASARVHAPGAASASASTSTSAPATPMFAPAPVPAPVMAPLAYPIRAAAPASLLERPEVRSARVRLEARDASPAELAAFYREAVSKALEETETAYATAVSTRAQRSAATELADTAERQHAAVLAQLEAGRVGRVQHIEAQIVLQDARLRVVEAENAYAKALATLERNLGR